MSNTNASQTGWHEAGLADDRNKANIPYIRNRIALAANKSTVSDLLDELEETRLSLTDALRRLAEVEAANRWIPCSERMPGGLGTCICVHSNGSTLAATQVFYHDKWLDSTNRMAPAYEQSDITHWRPLPPAPTEAP